MNIKLIALSVISHHVLTELAAVPVGYFIAKDESLLSDKVWLLSVTYPPQFLISLLIFIFLGAKLKERPYFQAAIVAIVAVIVSGFGQVFVVGDIYVSIVFLQIIVLSLAVLMGVTLGLKIKK